MTIGDRTFKPGDIVEFVGRPRQRMAVRACTDLLVSVDWIDDTTGEPRMATYVPEQLISTQELFERQAQEEIRARMAIEELLAAKKRKRERLFLQMKENE